MPPLVARKGILSPKVGILPGGVPPGKVIFQKKGQQEEASGKQSFCFRHHFPVIETVESHGLSDIRSLLGRSRYSRHSLGKP